MHTLNFTKNNNPGKKLHLQIVIAKFYSMGKNQIKLYYKNTTK